ncbi:MAG TPA: ATP-dependent RecD-like DNA helicase [Stellaceae bacterium]|nr:ATP-dependent RecD-like DNA helicase [Stellaceae bacterium]
MSGEQERAVAAIDQFMVDRRRSAFALHGLAGTGKTTVLAHIAGQYKHAALCTLTGKAASNLRRRFGLPAQTIHSFFYSLIEAERGKFGRKTLAFERVHEHDELHGDLVLLDECSMVNDALAQDLLRTGIKLIVTGDPGQLPPVTGQQHFTRADFTLTEIHRQALDSPIIRQAHRVRNGLRYEADGPDFRVQIDGTDDDLRAADVVLCWTNRTRAVVNQKCCAVRGFWQPNPQPGEPLVCLRNAPQYGIFNGGVYRLLEPFSVGDRNIRIDVDGTPTTIPIVRFEGVESALPDTVEPTTSFAFGYCMTVHKAQGSEWDSVILIDEYRKVECRREWLYTGITRAKQRILVTG